MADPYRTPPARPNPRMYACTQHVPACGDVPPRVMFAEMLREQAALQRKLLRLGRVGAAAAVVLSALPWVLIGLGPWPSANRCVVVDDPPLVEQIEAPIPAKEQRLAQIPAAAHIQRAWSSGPNRTSSARVRAIARANEQVLRAYVRRDVTVHHVSMTQHEVDRIMAHSDLRTQMQRVEIKGGEGMQIARLSKDGWLERLGFKVGDILVRFNGKGLSDPNVALAAAGDAQRAKHAVFELMRDGEPHVVSVSWEG